MIIDTFIICSSLSELMEQVKRVVANHPEREKVNADVQALQVDEIPDIPAGTYDAIIAKRLYSPEDIDKIFRDNTDYSCTYFQLYDIIRAVYECREKYHPKKITICGFRGRRLTGQPVYVKYWE